jgi:arylsulfatase A-like enzyme
LGLLLRALIDYGYRRHLQSLWSLDQAIGDILDQLQQQGRLDNTVIFYLSDNGFFWGEHRLTGKKYVYEEASHVPFALRYPPLTAAGRTEARLVANIDIAPTIYDLAGLNIPADVDGRSLVPLLAGQAGWRDDLLIEGWPEQTPPYRAVHTARHVYVETEGDRSELYDLERDPFQLENQANNPLSPLVAEMRERLRQLQPGRPQP